MIENNERNWADERPAIREQAAIRWTAYQGGSRYSASVLVRLSNRCAVVGNMED